MAGKQWSDEELWLVLLGALLMNGELLTTATSHLPVEAAPSDLQRLWAELRHKSAEGVAAALKDKGVAMAGKKAGVSVLHAVMDKQLLRHCELIVSQAELGKSLLDPPVLASLLESAAIKIRGAIAEKDKP